MRDVRVNEEVQVRDGPQIFTNYSHEKTLQFFVGAEEVNIPYQAVVKLGDAEPHILTMMVVKGANGPNKPDPVIGAWTTTDSSVKGGDKFTVISIPSK